MNAPVAPPTARQRLRQTWQGMAARERRLVAVATALVAAAVAWWILFAPALRTLRQVTAVTSENMRAALAFRDGHSAQKILHSLQADPHIQYAVALDERGSVLAQY